MTSLMERIGKVWFDGQMLDGKLATIPVLTHGLHYASCVYEGERAYGGTVFKLREHTDRLLRSASLMDMDFPYSRDEIENATREVLAVNGIQDGYIRPVAWRGSDTISTAAPGSRVHVAICAWEWPRYYSQESSDRGLRLAIARWRRPDPRSAPIEAKASGHYMILTLSKHEALRAGFDDALLLDLSGMIAEASSANVFFCRGDEIHTPRTDNILNGITRQTVMEIARGKGLRVIERDIRPDEMGDFDEAFVTGTACELMAVREIEGTLFQPGSVTEGLSKSFREMCRGQKAVEVIV
ncbi:MAG: branched-chain amino acid aminotransferase [Pseudomonadota bacterium]|nr:branched-chain amino acid aminotransferase [Pseudomonadota bacterium]